MAELSEYLKGDKPPQLEAPQQEAAPQVEVEQQTEPAPKPDRPRDETGKFVKGEDKPATASPDAVPPTAKVESKAKPPEVSGLEAGIAAERNKRQEAERRAAEYEARLRDLETRANPPAPPPDPVSDPQGFAQTLEQKMQEALLNQRVNLSASIAKGRFSDYDEVMGEWPALIQQNPALYVQAVQQEMPAEWAYQYVKRQQLLKEMGDDPSAYRTRLEAEIRQKLEAEYQQRTPVAPVIPAPPPSLASARSNGRMSEAVWSGPPPLSSAFKR